MNKERFIEKRMPCALIFIIASISQVIFIVYFKKTMRNIQGSVPKNMKLTAIRTMYIFTMFIFVNVFRIEPEYPWINSIYDEVLQIYSCGVSILVQRKPGPALTQFWSGNNLRTPLSISATDDYVCDNYFLFIIMAYIFEKKNACGVLIAQSRANPLNFKSNS